MITLEELKSTFLTHGVKENEGKVYITTSEGNIPIRGFRTFGSNTPRDILISPATGSNFVLLPEHILGWNE